MDPIQISLIAIVGLLVLLAIGVNISSSFFLTGFLGIVLILGIRPALSTLGSVAYFSIATPAFAALPLFILMGGFAAASGFAEKAYKAMYTMTSKLPGSLAIATSFACAFFGAICGSSLATAAVFGAIAMPQMERYQYNQSLAAGTIAAAGTFASMIPPSSLLIIYGLLTNQSIGKLFLAGIVPGLITALVYSLSIIIRVKLNPNLAPMETKITYPREERVKSIVDTWPMVLLIFIVLGGIYSGVFTPTEAAASGSFATLVLGIMFGKLNSLKIIKGAVKESAHTTAMVFMIMIGAFFLGRFVAITNLANNIANRLDAWEVPGFIVLAGILILWFLLGMVITPAAIFALTLPVLFPIIIRFGYDPIWFGIISLKLSEIAAVTPPVGLNAYTLKGVLGQRVSLETIFKGIWPFVICDLLVLLLLIAFPKIVLFLPNLL